MTNSTKPTFQGFPKQLPKFLSDLANNNSRDWFEANKPDFTRYLTEPALDFIEAMAPIVENFSFPLRAEARLNGSLRRIHRDVRFSKDKTPYNPRLHMIFWSGSHPNKSPACHIVIGPDHFGIGSGQWGFDKVQIECFRNALMKTDNLKSLASAIKVAENDGQILDDPALKRLPKGYQAEGLLENLLRQKGIVVRNHNEKIPSSIFNDECAHYVSKRLKQSLAVNKWLAANI